MRPRRLVFVTGTGTEIGKTWVGAALLSEARRRGRTVAARKPVQSFALGDAVTDADVLGEASGEDPFDVCPPDARYPVAMAPPMAAAALGRRIATIAEMAAALERSWPEPPAELGLVEGAGGVASPLAADGDNRDLAQALDPDAVLIVSAAGLGAINSVRLAALALGGPRPMVYLNRFDGSDELHRLNLQWLGERDGFTVACDPLSLLRALEGG